MSRIAGEPKRDQVREMAKAHGIELSHRVNVAEPINKTRNKTKEMLVREIQAAEGYNACYKTEVEACEHSNCLWFKSCQ